MYDYKIATPEEIERLTRQAHEMRAQAVRSAVQSAAKTLSGFFHRLFARHAHS